MKLLDNFLTGGHSFSENENLQRFRFALLNSMLFISVSFTLLNYFASKLELVTFSPAYENSLLAYTLSNLLYLYLLKKKKSYYIYIVHLSIIGAFALFYFALISLLQDEFRLIWFFLSLFGGFVLIGKRYGLFLMLFTLGAIFITNLVLELGYTKLAIFTFFNSFLIFSAFAYSFLHKIEKDELEFQVLNNRLKEKVSEEVKQRQEQEQMLLHQCRMASMGEMIDSIAHQWRQPLMNINAILMNMERGIETKDEPKEYLEGKMNEVITLTTHMSQTIEDFRSLFRPDKEKIKFNILHSMEQTLELFHESTKDINIKTTISKELLYFGYENELIQSIIILLSNSIEVLKHRGIQEKHIDITCHTIANNLNINIEDNAGGIEKENIKHIFDPYFTTKKGTGGTGLGLYIANIIIEQNMQGTLTVSNTKKGAKFEISIPKH